MGGHASHKPVSAQLPDGRRFRGKIGEPWVRIAADSDIGDSNR